MIHRVGSGDHVTFSVLLNLYLLRHYRVGHPHQVVHNHLVLQLQRVQYSLEFPGILHSHINLLAFMYRSLNSWLRMSQCNQEVTIPIICLLSQRADRVMDNLSSHECEEHREKCLHQTSSSSSLWSPPDSQCWTLYLDPEGCLAFPM